MLDVIGILEYFRGHGLLLGGTSQKEKKVGMPYLSLKLCLKIVKVPPRVLPELPLVGLVREAEEIPDVLGLGELD